MNKTFIVMGRTSYISILSVLRSLSGFPGDKYVVTCRENTFLMKLNRHFTIESASRYCTKEYIVEPDEETLTRFLMDTFRAEDRGVIIPTDDFSVHVIESSRELLEKHFVLPGSAKYSFNQLSNKSFQKKIAAEEIGLRTAEERAVRVRNHTYSIPEDLEYPVFAKPETSIDGRKSMQKRCDTPEEVKAVLMQTDRMDHDAVIILEQFNEIEEECCTVGISDGTTVFLPYYVIGEYVGSGRSQGVIGQGRVRCFSELPWLHERFSELIRNIGFKGIFDIDFYKSDGKWFFNEINLRIGGSSMAFSEAGIDFPELYVKMLENGGKLDEIVRDIPVDGAADLTFVNERVLLDSWSDGHITFKEMIRLKRKADTGFLIRKDDLGMKMLISIGFELAKRVVNRLLNVVLGKDVQMMAGA